MLVQPQLLSSREPALDCGEVAEAFELGSESVKCPEHLLRCGVSLTEAGLVREFIDTRRLAEEGIDALPLLAALAR